MSESIPLSGRTADALRRRIRSGELASGQRLPVEAALMEELGVGRSTLREAVKILEREGILRVRQGSGTYVQQPDRSKMLVAAFATTDASQISEVRRILEPPLARMAAIRRTPDQAREVLRLARERDRYRELRDVENEIQADIAFHSAIAAAANNPVLTDLFKAFAVVLTQLVTAEMQDLDTDLCADLHDRLAQAVAIGDPDDAEATMHAILDEG